LNDADKLFIKEMFKGSELSQESIAALGIQRPEDLDTLEDQAQGTGEEAPIEEPPVRSRQVLNSEKTTVVELPSNTFSRDNVHPLALVAYLKSLYDDEWAEWLPETLWQAVRSDVGSISDVNKNKVQALALSLSTDFPWKDWTTFENVGLAFNDTIPVFGQMQPLNPSETAFTIRTLKKLNTSRDIDPVKFSDEVLGYIASVCLSNGIVHAPSEWFGPVQSLVDEQNNNKEIVPDLLSAWKSIKNTDEDLSDASLNENDPSQVYVSRMLVIREYLRSKKELLRAKK